jgi:hypothetical protein
LTAYVYGLSRRNAPAVTTAVAPKAP